ncbi:hypothetical protein PP749_gp009 [Rhizobium phage RHEph22]|uniref:Uncharacterized protein n=1 Tax=Rhizobium phage RHEph22 TaxID=2836135 RepID=A0AAE7VMV1_9CAUD|nr:hypothetical protein PP749_gp009 [Rhizobium phage RHEph22]QXV74682.1 hypothetical protein [Rhizobium phage RHEph22]
MVHTYRLAEICDGRTSLHRLDDIEELGAAHIVAREISRGNADRNAIFILVMNNITEKVECIYYNGERYERV